MDFGPRICSLKHRAVSSQSEAQCLSTTTTGLPQGSRMPHGSASHASSPYLVRTIVQHSLRTQNAPASSRLGGRSTVHSTLLTSQPELLIPKCCADHALGHCHVDGSRHTHFCRAQANSHAPQNSSHPHMRGRRPHTSRKTMVPARVQLRGTGLPHTLDKLIKGGWGTATTCRLMLPTTPHQKLRKGDQKQVKAPLWRAGTVGRLHDQSS